MKLQSTVKWFDAKKGYGFLVHPETGADVFVHYTSIHSDSRFRTLRTGEPITFELYDGPKGLHARDVVSLDPLPEEATAPGALFTPTLAAHPGLSAPAAAPSALPTAEPAPASVAVLQPSATAH